jgi:ABC-2 type transport system ATP-binding protein
MISPAKGETPRVLQARLLATPGIVDAVPHAGRVRFVRASAAPAGDDLSQAEPVAAKLEDGFMVRLREANAAAGGAVDGAPPARTGGDPAPAIDKAPEPGGKPGPAPVAPISRGPRAPAGSGDTVIEVHDLMRKFGDFVAVRHTNFDVRRGEVFGLLGPNGAGKTTTFRMLCGLLPPSGGSLRVAGLDMRRAPGAARRRIGYVSQRFALYGNLSCAENLEFFARAYGLRGAAVDGRVHELAASFELESMLDVPAAKLPGGYRQRLAMAAALLHEPGILFLDEPTSGADPLARRDFWRRITALAAQGTTVVVTTHFMEEAEYCDRIVIQDAGAVLALGTPDAVRAQAGNADDMEQAFIGIVERARGERRQEAA